MPLLWLSLAFLSGIVLASLQPAHWGVWAGLMGVALALGAANGFLEPHLRILEKWRKWCPLPLGIVLAALFAGALRYQLAQPRWTPEDLAWYNDSGLVEMTGTITSPPDVRDRAVLLRVAIREVRPIGENGGKTLPVEGLLLARLPAGGQWAYGDKIKLTGKPVTPPENEDFSYKDYLARQKIYTYLTYPKARRIEWGAGSLILKAIYSLRETAYQRINAFLPQPEASLLAGILLGIESDIPDAVEAAFQETGTTHIIAISGFNISILAGLFIVFTGRIFSRRWAPLAAAVGITAYTLLVGAQPPVVRAAIMGGLALFGQHIGRRQSGVNTLGFTAAVMALFNPLIPWDAGFQLSFAATLGLVLYADPLQEWFTKQAQRLFSEETAGRIAGPVSEYLLFTLAAQVTTLPIIAYHFERVSLSSMLANPLILPPQPLVMILGGIAVLVGLVLPPVGQALAYLSWPLLAYTIRMVELLARIPFGSFALGSVSLLVVIGFYIVLFGATAAKKRVPGVQPWLKPGLVMMATLLAATVVWQSVLVSPDSKLRLIVLNVADGPAVLLQSPGGHNVLINGGSSTREMSDPLGRRLPLIRRKLDALVLTTQTSAALQGLPGTLERFPPGQVFWREPPTRTAAGRRLAEQVFALDVPLHNLVEGEALGLGDGAALTVLAHTEQGTALLVEWQDFTALLPGGVPLNTILWKGEQRARELTAVVLTGADLEYYTPEDWQALSPLVLLSPELAVSGAPNPVCWLEHDWVALTTDGTHLWVERGD